MPRNVFIVEDNELLVRMYRSIFHAMDCSVTHATTTRDALRLLHGLRTDLIIIDDRLADGSGIDATHKIRLQLQDADTPIIATVSQLSMLDDEAVRSAGYASIITKPFQVSDFSALARRHISSKGTSMAAIA